MTTPRIWLEEYAPGPVVRRSASYTVPACNGQCVIVGALSAACVITLPAAPVLGQIVIVKRAGASDYALTVSGNGARIDGAASMALAMASSSVIGSAKAAVAGKASAAASKAVRNLGNILKLLNRMTR